MIRAGNEIRAALIRADNRVMLHDMAGRTRTARQLLENVDRVAGALIARGAYGGKIGLWYRNSLRAVEAFLAVEWIGGTRVPVDPHAPEGGLCRGRRRSCGRRSRTRHGSGNTFADP
jgi:fatty-acyl-CoA synthase